jgi:transcription elongation factor Elf1
MKKINKLGSCPFCGEKVKEHKFQYNMLQAVCTKCGERWGCLHGKLYW